MFGDIKSLLDVIRKIKRANKFHKYIDFIQFPYYRNLELNERITFDFPLTVFIGQNGCGKSSALHALFGTVKGKTPGNFWFDTKVDPIQYYNDERKRHSFWYGYKNQSGTQLEVVKARIQRANNPNYWETSRPLTWAGMQMGLLRNGRRNQPIEKNVIYLDFRGELSAFDKFFYFGDLKHTKSKSKQEFIRKRSNSLKKILDDPLKVIHSTVRNLNKPSEVLSANELMHISYILGRNYTSCRSVFHSLFRNEGYSVLFHTNFAKYSEAFAGSGEMAIVRLVREVLAAPNYSLILLDEPEVSLHPGAQARVKLFLLDQIKRKKHQIIITSHSPTLIKDLPKEAIKVFSQNFTTGRFSVNENLHPDEAFFHIESPIENRKNIIVEDKLGKEIVDAVLGVMGEATASVFNIKYYPGGESVLKTEFIPVYCRENSSKEFVLFDGDQKKEASPYDWRSFRIDELNIEFLKSKIRALTGLEIELPVDSLNHFGNETQQIQLLKDYLDFYNSNVFYFPKDSPEELIWNGNKAEQLISVFIPDSSSAQRIISEINDLPIFKSKFAKLAKVMSGDDSSSGIFQIQKMFIQLWLEQSNEDLNYLKDFVDQIIQRS